MYVYNFIYFAIVTFDVGQIRTEIKNKGAE